MHNGGIKIELPSLRRIGGCVQSMGVFGLLFLDGADILPIRLVTECRDKLSKKCSQDTCQRYRIGTVGGCRIHWDKEGMII